MAEIKGLRETNVGLNAANVGLRQEVDQLETAAGAGSSSVFAGCGW